MNSQLVSRLLGVGSASAGNVILTALQSLLLGHILSIESFGITRAATAYMVLLTMIGHFTLHNALSSSILRARDPAEVSRYIANATVMVLGISLTTALVAIAYIVGSGDWRPEIEFPLIVVIGCLPLVCLTIVYNACLEALGAYKIYTVVILLNGLLPLLLLVGGAKFLGLDGWLAGRVLSALLLLCVSAYVVRRHFDKLHIDIVYCRNLFAFARIQIFSGLLSLALLSADVIFLERITEDLRAVANYGVALLFVNASAFMPTALGRVYIKDVAPDTPAGQRKRIEFLSLIAALAGIAALGLYFVGPVFIRLFFGEGYETGQSIIRVMAVGVLFSFIWNALSVINVASGHPRRAVAISAAGATVGIIALLLLVPRHSGIGAAWAMNMAYAAGVVVGGCLLWRQRTQVEISRAG